MFISYQLSNAKTTPTRQVPGNTHQLCHAARPLPARRPGHGTGPCSGLLGDATPNAQAVLCGAHRCPRFSRRDRTGRSGQDASARKAPHTARLPAPMSAFGSTPPPRILGGGNVPSCIPPTAGHNRATGTYRTRSADLHGYRLKADHDAGRPDSAILGTSVVASGSPGMERCGRGIASRPLWLCFASSRDARAADPAAVGRCGRAGRPL